MGLVMLSKKLGFKHYQRNMRERKQKIRVIVRPWNPRKIPYSISFQQVNEIIKEAQPKIKNILYVGWARRSVGDKKVLQYLVATGETSSKARKAFKMSIDFGENIWIVS